MSRSDPLSVLCATILAVTLASLLAVLPARAFQGSSQPESALSTLPLRFEHLSLEDGLSQNAILSMLQDRQGFLWFGTQDGLNLSLIHI